MCALKLINYERNKYIPLKAGFGEGMMYAASTSTQESIEAVLENDPPTYRVRIWTHDL